MSMRHNFLTSLLVSIWNFRIWLSFAEDVVKMESSNLLSCHSIFCACRHRSYQTLIGLSHTIYWCIICVYMVDLKSINVRLCWIILCLYVWKLNKKKQTKKNPLIGEGADESVQTNVHHYDKDPKQRQIPLYEALLAKGVLVSPPHTYLRSSFGVIFLFIQEIQWILFFWILFS